MEVRELQRFAWSFSTFGRWIGIHPSICTTLLETWKFRGKRDLQTWQQVLIRMPCAQPFNLNMTWHTVASWECP
jgi:hypothetical protein